MPLDKIRCEIIDPKRLERIVQIAKGLPREQSKELLENLYEVIRKTIQLGYKTHLTECSTGDRSGFSLGKRAECDGIIDYLKEELAVLNTVEEDKKIESLDEYDKPLV